MDHGLPGVTSRVNGTATGPFYDPVQRLWALGIYPVTAPFGAAFGYGRNAAGQITSVSRDNDAYAWTGHYAISRAYTANGLNQYTAAGPASFAYDANGNLAADGANSYVYDVENRLIAISGAHDATLAYDPLGRLAAVTAGAGTMRFLYDGDALVVEYNDSGTVQHRYAHWVGQPAPAEAGVPMVWYEGRYLDNPHPPDRRRNHRVPTPRWSADQTMRAWPAGGAGRATPPSPAAAAVPARLTRACGPVTRDGRAERGKIMKKFALFVATLGAASALPAAPAANRPDGDANEMMCRTQHVTGSRLGRTRQCATRAEWLQRDRVEREALRAAQRQGNQPVCISPAERAVAAGRYFALPSSCN